MSWAGANLTIQDTLNARQLRAQELRGGSVAIDTLDAADANAEQATVDTLSAQTLTVAQDTEVQKLCLDTLNATALQVQDLTVTTSSNVQPGVIEADTVKTNHLEPPDGQYAVTLGNTKLKLAPAQPNIEVVTVGVQMDHDTTAGSVLNPAFNQHEYKMGPYDIDAMRVGHVISGSINALHPGDNTNQYPNPSFFTTNFGLQTARGLVFTFTLPAGVPYQITGAQVTVMPALVAHNSIATVPAGLNLVATNPTPANTITLATGQGAADTNAYEASEPNSDPDGQVSAVSPYNCYVGARFELYLTAA